MSSLHPWELSPKEAIDLQRRLRAQISLQPPSTPIRYISGGDISYNRFASQAFGAFVTLDLTTMEVVEEVSGEAMMTFPYVPGLLSFREIPVLLAAWQKLSIQPDVVFIDGQGIAHPRRMGIASHFGLWVDRPTIGCGKSLLYGKLAALGEEAGAWAEIRDGKDVIGIALRTKARCLPVIISPGHQMDLTTSVMLTKSLIGKYRIPEPTRLAHLLANRVRCALGSQQKS